MWCYFCDDAKGGTLFPSSVTCIFPLFEHSKGSTFIRLSKRIERIFAFFCLLFYTLYIYTRARALPGCVRLDHALPHHTTHHAHQGSSFWSISDASVFSFLSSRESGIYRGEVRRLRILDSRRLRYFGVPWRLLVSLSSRESRICDERVEGLRILDSQRLPFGASWRLLVSLFSPCENRESVDRGLGGAKLVILREDFSGEGEFLFLHSNLSSTIC